MTENLWTASADTSTSSLKPPTIPEADKINDEEFHDHHSNRSLRRAETILLAEDEEMVWKLARQVLEMYGYQVLEAANGGAALLICERHKEPINLLVSDVIMPEMSGRELADRLAQLRPEMKVLYMSCATTRALQGRASW